MSSRNCCRSHSPVGSTCCVGVVGFHLKVIENNRDLLVGRREEHKRAVRVGWVVGRITW